MYSANQFDWDAQVELSEILQNKNKEGSHIILTNINDNDKNFVMTLLRRRIFQICKKRKMINIMGT